MPVFDADDTIVAIATPHGRGGIGVVRISGPEALAVAVPLIGQALTPRHATFARLMDPATGHVVDQVVATWFDAPQSYTGDHVVEISAHGSPLLLTQIVQLAIDRGARLAEPGEFTFRAYLRGRLNLAQAEAVADLVDAVTPLQARSAMDQLEGTLTAAIGRIDASLFDLSAKLEASLDYPDEGFHFVTRPEVLAEIGRIAGDMDALIAAGDKGRVIREGRTIAIVGRPNAGKSSLFNALLGTARSIVTEIPGTTRDLLTERVDINGVAVTLVDTAGLRDAGDAIEAEGVRLAREAGRIAALRVVVIDRSQPLLPDDLAVARTDRQDAIIVASKADLPPAWRVTDLGSEAGDVVAVSSTTGEGLEALRARIASVLIGSEELRDPPAISNVRHLKLVADARRALGEAYAALESGATEELVLTDLGRARASLEEISGRRTTDDLLTHIFSRFCLGK